MPVVPSQRKDLWNTEITVYITDYVYIKRITMHLIFTFRVNFRLIRYINVIVTV